MYLSWTYILSTYSREASLLEKKVTVLQGTVAIISSVHIASRHIEATLVNSALKFVKLIFNWGLVKGVVYLEKHLY